MTKNNKTRFAVGIDCYQLWHEKFAAALKKKIDEGQPLEYEVISLESNDWIDKAKEFDVIIWKSDYMGVQSSLGFKEKIFFLETIMNKTVIPNYRTVWHFESKIAQSYLFSKYEVRTPKTVVSFDFEDAVKQLEQARLPLVMKLSHGAGSKNVTLVKDKKEVLRRLTKIFSHQLWNVQKHRLGLTAKLFFLNALQPWMWQKIVNVLSGREQFGSVYWQEFIKGNDADLRVTAIGDRYAFAFWRNNRPNDFRASGSGRLDFVKAVPEDVIRACLDMNRKMDFDSMAYDILFTPEGFTVVEMSYAYLDSAIYKSSGFYELKGNELRFEKGHYWPQEKWVDWAVIRGNSARNSKGHDQ